MMKKLSFHTLLIILLGSSIISSCSSSKHKPSEYISATGIASPGVETKIELEDGAGIVIPADSIDQQVNVKVERNPEKANSLQPLDKNVTQLSDFYNFEIEGNVNAPVDLILPFNAENIPNETGILVYAYPTESGWEYIPVAPEGNKVRLYTTSIGDPLIAWHFANPEKIEETIKDFKYCDPTIAVSVIPEQGESTQDYKIVGRIEPLSQDITTKLGDKLASLILGQATSSFGNLPIEISINNDPQKTISTRTNQDGSFEVTINPENDSPLGFKEKLNILQVKTQCDSLLPSGTSLATGYSYFYINPKEQAQTTDAPVVEQPIESPIPTGAVLLPDFVGQSIDDAINWLKTNGFKYTWIDGSSTYDLGIVYTQAPAGNQYKVPRRTVVLLYRTIKTDLATEAPNTAGDYALEIQEQDCRTRSNGTTQCKYQPVTIALSYDENTETFYGESAITWEVTDYYRMSGVVYSASASSTETIKVEGKKSTRNDGYIRFSIYYSGTTIPPRIFDKKCCTLTDPSLTFDSGVHTVELKDEDGAIFTDGSIKEWPSASDFIQAILHIQK